MVFQFVYGPQPTCCVGGWEMMFDSLAQGTLFEVYKNGTLVVKAKGLYHMTTYTGDTAGRGCSSMFCPVVDKMATIYDAHDNELFYYSELSESTPSV